MPANKISEFREEYFFLSNFAETTLTLDGLTFQSAEAAFQSMKARSKEIRATFCSMTPRQAKAAGRTVELCQDWEQVKDSIMKRVLIAKFRDIGLRTMLLATGDALLVEGNSWNDTYWGVCGGKGQNKLGTLLMEVRELYRYPRRLFVDMDGTVVEWKAVSSYDELYEKGYFSSLEPYQTVVDAIQLIHEEIPVVDIFTLSAVLPDSLHSIPEKNVWLDNHMPFIDEQHRLFTWNGTPKHGAAPGGIRLHDTLLDDYSKNLFEWEADAAVTGAKGVKLLNGINGTQGTWQHAWKGACVSRYAPPGEIVTGILSRMFDGPLPWAEALTNR